MLNHEELRQLVKEYFTDTYFTEATDEQIEMLLEELVREIEIMTHAKIRELVNCERLKKSTEH